jgi:putative transposase
MPTNRKIVFNTDSYYHIFNRGIDRRLTFIKKKDYQRTLDLLYYYQFNVIPIRYSQFCLLIDEIRQKHLQNMIDSGTRVEIISYCFMPNHFHLLIKQKCENGISGYMSNFVNAYTRYFNKKNQRSGVLFQGIFKAVFIESDEQLLHLTRYIHFNPVVSSLVKPKELMHYAWSSYPDYILEGNNQLIKQDTIASITAQTGNYEKFCQDQIAYGKELEKIKHLTFG